MKGPHAPVGTSQSQTSRTFRSRHREARGLNGPEDCDRAPHSHTLAAVTGSLPCCPSSAAPFAGGTPVLVSDRPLAVRTSQAGNVSGFNSLPGPRRRSLLPCHPALCLRQHAMQDCRTSGQGRSPPQHGRSASVRSHSTDRTPRHPHVDYYDLQH
jgi:hypothetical protein